MNTKKFYQYEVPFKVVGIPALIGVYDCYNEGFEYDILDRKGYHAKWLESKLTPSMEDEIYETVLKYVKDLSNDYY